MTNGSSVPPPPPKPSTVTVLPDPPTKGEIEKLIPNNLRYQAGKGGLIVLDAPGGVVVAQFNEKGVQRRFNGDAKRWVNQVLSTIYPNASSAAVFGREGERERLAIGMRSRLKTAMEGPVGSVVGLESLDPDPNRLIPANPNDITPANHKTLPRHLTWVVLEPSPPRRYIAMSEMTMLVQGEKKRPDEVFISYELDKDELDRVTTIETDSKGVKTRVLNPDYDGFAKLDKIDAHNLRIHIGDPNLEISKGSAREHFAKTNKYLIAVLEQLTNPRGSKPTINPKGRVYLSARDVYMSPAMLSLGRFKASAVRWVQDLSSLAQGYGMGSQAPTLTDNSVIHVETVLERDASGSWSQALDNGIPLTRSRVSGKLSKTGLQAIVDAVIKPGMIDAAIDVLKKHSK
jgi:hypothetical protein